MFEKNYDEKIEILSEGIGHINDSIKNLIESLKNLRELYDSSQDGIMQMAIIQNQHKQIISFLMNHTSVDTDAQKDFEKMLSEVSKIEKDVKKKLEKK